MQSYYAVAARMGDADAQMDLAFCLANGKGTKKDRKEAAKWYRAAVCLIPFFWSRGFSYDSCM
jgi:TPR repeat protein